MRHIGVFLWFGAVSGCSHRLGALDLVTTDPGPSLAQDEAPVPTDALIWYAMAVHAVETGDRDGLARAVAWMERLDLGHASTQLAIMRVLGRAEAWDELALRLDQGDAWEGEASLWRGRLAVARGEASAVDWLWTAAQDDVLVWPEVWAATSLAPTRRESVLQAWLAVSLPAWAREARGRAALERQHMAVAAEDLGAAFDWGPTPERLTLWTKAAAGACRLGRPWLWVYEQAGLWTKEAWRPALQALAEATGDRALGRAVDQSVSGGPACDPVTGAEASFLADPADPDHLLAWAEVVEADGDAALARRLRRYAAELDVVPHRTP